MRLAWTAKFSGAPPSLSVSGNTSHKTSPTTTIRMGSTGGDPFCKFGFTWLIELFRVQTFSAGAAGFANHQAEIQQDVASRQKRLANALHHGGDGGGSH